MKAIAAAIALCLVVGCANQANEKAQKAVEAYYLGDYPKAVETLKPLAKKTDENFVLNNLRLGYIAMSSYDLEQAEASYLQAYEVINAMGVNNGGRTAAALLVDEKIKVWKGEPYERAMANFYLGVIYYMRQDYNNARAAFENALFKLRTYSDTSDGKHFTESESTFAPAMLMLGRCYQRLGREDLARANFEKAKKAYGGLEGLADWEVNASANLLLVVDYGYAPRKVTEFDGSVVTFTPKPWEAGPIPPPSVRVDGEPAVMNYSPAPTVDLVAMAQDRKWENIDTLRALKSGIGTGLIAGGAVEGIRGINGSGARQRTDLMVSGALIGTGLLLKATSQADIRQWETLPRTVFILPLHVEPGIHDVTVSFADGLRQTWHKLVIPPAGGEASYYFRMQRWNQGPFDWPPPTMAQVPVNPAP